MTATVPPLARTERAQLCDLFDEVGPDAPTLCGGWTTYDLAAHLVTRERRPDAGPGLLLRPLAGWTDAVRRRAKATPYPELVDKVRSGPPLLSMFALPGADSATNTVEFYVHHEDVRRASGDWAPRELTAAQQDELWRRLRAAAKLLFRRCPVGVVLRRPTGETATARPGTPAVTVTGEPGELLLFGYGRGAHARVAIEGDAEARRLLADSPLGV